jgi:hypothetical protein
MFDEPSLRQNSQTMLKFLRRQRIKRIENSNETLTSWVLKLIEQAKKEKEDGN